MEPKDKLEPLRFIAEAQRKAAQERSVTEWKVVFTALTFFVLCAAAKFRIDIDVSSTLATNTWMAFLLLAACTSWFLTFVHGSNRRNKHIAHLAERAIQEILNGKDPALDLYHEPDSWLQWSRLTGKGKGGMWTWIWQTVALFIFASAASAVIAS